RERTKMKSMEKGEVSWFNLHRGQGFIRSESGNDVFVGYEDIEQFGGNLRAGDKVEFEVELGPKGTRARSVRVVENATRRPRIRRATEKTKPEKSASLLLAQALLAKQEKAYDKARRLFESSLALEPRIETFYSYAAMERELRLYDKARSVF